MMKTQEKNEKKQENKFMCEKTNARHRGNKGGDSGQLES